MLISDDFSFNPIKTFELGSRQPWNWILVNKIKSTNTKSLTYILKNNRVIFRNFAFSRVQFGVDIINWVLMLFNLLSEFVIFVRDGISPFGCGIMTLEGITISNIRQFINGHSASSFSAESILFVLAIHHFLAERALLEVKVDWIHRHQFGQQHAV